ncbi:MAG TPA: hypothetical protein ACFCUD_11365 [Cyclobacteriaceae bacterium]
MKLIDVNDKRTSRKFIQFPVGLYKNEKNWIRPLDKDIEAVFDPLKNKTFKNGSCERWLLEHQGNVIGRIAAFVNEKTVFKDNDQPTGGVGFFDCINNQEAANILFDKCKAWLSEKGMEAMDGPINFGERDAWWGLLVDGFHIQPNYRCNYHYPYYQMLFENYGWQVYFKQFTFVRKIIHPFHPRIYQKAELTAKDPNFHYKQFKLSALDKFTEDFRVIYNKAWASHEGVAEMSEAQAKAIINSIKPIIDEKIIMFAYYKDEPAAFYINLPEVNQLFKHVNGKLDLAGKLKFLWHRTIRSNKKMLGLVFGVVPEYQGKGLDGGIVIAMANVVQGTYQRYKDLEMNWIGDFNRKMVLVARQIGGDIGKTHHTYRYLFDREKEFKRMPIK